MTATLAVPSAPPAPTPRRRETGLAGRLNAEWAHLCADPTTGAAMRAWAGAHPALAGCADLPALERRVARAGRAQADDILLALLRLGRRGDELASRTVLQLMLGKAIRIASSHAGRDVPAALEEAAITALWTVIATYPVDRRTSKVAANIAMETLHLTVADHAHQRHETPTTPDDLHRVDAPHRDVPPDLELVELLAWAVDTGTVTAQDATLVLDVYAPGPGCRGGSAAAQLHGLSWAAARQRCSRAVRKIAAAVRADSPPPTRVE